MRYLIIMFIVAVFVVAVIFIRRRRQQNSMPDSHIHLCILFGVSPSVDGDIVMQQFKHRWKANVACGEAERLGPQQEGCKTYLMGNGTHNLRVTVSQVPLPSALVNVTIDGAPEIADADNTAMHNHKGYISIDYLLGPTDDAVARVRFAAQALLSLAELDGALGYVNVSAMLYRPRSHVETFLNQSELESTDLYMLFARTHSVEDNGGTWVHTHGLEQFSVPDLQTRFTDAKQHDYYWELISDASIYMIENGPVLKPGDTAELKGDGVIYEIKSAKPDPDHPFGSFGCLEIVRKLQE